MSGGGSVYISSFDDWDLNIGYLHVEAWRWWMNIVAKDGTYMGIISA